MLSKIYTYSEQAQTNRRTDTTLETPISSKYIEVWKRALQKIKTQLLLKRFMNLSRHNPYILSEDLLQVYVQDSLPLKIAIAKNFVLLPYSQIYLFWLLLLFISLSYISTFGLFITSFIGDSPGSPILRFEVLIDLVFLLDILFTFNLSVYDHSNRLITSRRIIAIEYIKGRLVLDLVSAIPASTLVNSGILSPGSFLMMFRHTIRMIKWFGIWTKIRNFSLLKKIDYIVIKYKTITDSLNLILKLVIPLHIFGCLFFLIGRYEEFSDQTWIVHSGLIDCSFDFQYLSSLYWALTTVATVGFGALHPYTPFEILFTMVLMLFGILLLSLTVNQSATIIKNFENSDLRTERNMLLAHDLISIFHIPSMINKRLKKCIIDEKIIIRKFKTSKIFQALNSNLRYEIATNIYNKAITKIPFLFLKSQEFIGYFTFLLEYVKYDIEEYVWCEKSKCDGIYFIFQGIVKYLCEGIIFNVCHEGGFFGDFEIFLKTQRKFDVGVCGICKCFRLGIKALKKLKTAYPRYYVELQRMAKIRRENLMYGLAQMIAIHRFKRGEISLISKRCVEEIKEEYYEKLFSKDDFMIEKRILNGMANDLEKINEHQRRVKSLLQTLGIQYKELRGFDTNEIETNRLK